jgi:two-component system, chemotaxis family, protein-glutamate methylesterase/glutaminase
MEIENGTAEGIFSVDDWWVLKQMSEPSGLNCPDCHSALYELNDKRILRFRCRSGHAFSGQSLLSGQADARESLLSSIFGALIEEATMAKRLRADTRYNDDVTLTGKLSGRVVELESEAGKLCEWLHIMTGLVQPEP